MKILLLYTPRCGSTSILKYFEKIKTEYECFNEPWFEWMVENISEIKTYQLFQLKKIGHARLSQVCDEEIQKRKVASFT